MKPLRVFLRGYHALERTMSEPVEPTPAVPYPNPWMLGQAQREQVLRTRLADVGTDVERATAFTGVTQHDDGVTVTLSTGKTVDCDYLVGADGGGGAVRRALGIGFPGTRRPGGRV